MKFFLKRNCFVFAMTFIILTLFFGSTVHAYLDPGMGTLLLQLLAGAALVIGIGWRYILRFFKNLIKKFKNNKPSEPKV